MYGILAQSYSYWADYQGIVPFVSSQVLEEEDLEIRTWEGEALVSELWGSSTHRHHLGSFICFCVLNWGLYELTNFPDIGKGGYRSESD